MAKIETNLVTTNGNLSYMGLSGAEYKVEGVNDGKAIDFQDLMVAFAEERASVLEDEVVPMSTRIRKRNSELEELGNVLADLSAIQARYGTNDTGSSEQAVTNSTTISVVKALGGSFTSDDANSTTITKANCEKAVQLVKTKIDKLNNESSSDMTRLQSLVDMRDESYSTATSLMESVADTRSSLIKNL